MLTTIEFENRAEAGQRLAGALHHLRGSRAAVLGLPRGGIPVASEVARELELPLDILVVRKLGVPDYPEVAMGAIGEGGVRVLDPEVVAFVGINDAEVAVVEAVEAAALRSRVSRFRKILKQVDLTGRTAIIVDDGIATGATARAACQIARQRGAGRIIVAAPVSSREAVRALDVADEVVCLLVPPGFSAVGAYYRDFTTVTEDDVEALLIRSQERMKPARTRRPGEAGRRASD